jgi:transcriptional regulator with GAF, ATPase, and Fis domain
MFEQKHPSETAPATRPPLPQAGESRRLHMPLDEQVLAEPLSPELLVPRLGELLLQKGLLEAEQLQQALDHQRANAIAGNPRLLGQVLVELGMISQDSLDRVITEQIISLQNALKDSNQRLEQLIQHSTDALNEANFIYAATSRIARATGFEEVLKISRSTLKKTPHVSLIILAEGDAWQIDSYQNPEDAEAFENLSLPSIAITQEQISGYFSENRAYTQISTIHSMDEHNPFQIWARSVGCIDAFFIPLWDGQTLYGLWMLGTRQPRQLQNIQLQPYLALAEYTSTTLSKIRALEQANQQVKRLQILNSLSQAITAELDLNALFEVVHRQVALLLGDTGFYIALYDSDNNTITFPYLFEEGELLQIDPIPLGEGLTSHVIRTREPLLLVEDTEKKAFALGAKIVGKFARSWLGVPLQIGEEILGVMTIQDVEREHAFTEEDKRLFVILASQVSIAIRNARLVESIRKQADYQRVLFELTEKIRRSVDMDTILATSTTELGRVLGARRVTIRLQPGEAEPQSRQPHLLKP